MLKGGYGIKILVAYLPEAEEKAKELGTKIYTEEGMIDVYHIAVSCDFPPRSAGRREFDNFLQLLRVREMTAAQA